MMTTEQQKIAKLEADHPGWQVWVVHRVYGGPVWCARPWADETAVVNMDSAEQLSEYLSEHPRCEPR
jgi:hypothetical protein